MCKDFSVKMCFMVGKKMILLSDILVSAPFDNLEFCNFYLFY